MSEPTIHDIEHLVGVIEQQQETIDRQRNALQLLRSALRLLLNAIWIHVNSGGNDEQLKDAYRVVSSASTMTGTEEQ